LKELEDKISRVKSLEELEKVRIDIFGKKGALASRFAKLKDVPNKEKKAFAKGLNEKKIYLQKLYDEVYKRLKEEEIELLLRAGGDRCIPLWKIGE